MPIPRYSLKGYSGQPAICTAKSALSFSLIERIIPEEGLGTEEFFSALGSAIAEEIRQIRKDADFKEKRYKRFRAF